jgi:hypothetical protein
MSHEIKPNVFTGIIKYLPLITIAALAFMAWGDLRTTNGANEKRLTTLEMSDRTSRDTQNQMLVQLSQIQADLGWIKNQLK